jgi:AraC-like DNA-binding protein
LSDVLAEVLDALQLRAIDTARVPSGAASAAPSGPGDAACYVLLEGRVRLDVDGREYTLLRNDVLLVLEHEHEQPATAGGDVCAGSLLRCRFRLDRGSLHPLTTTLPRVVQVNADSITDETELGRIVRLLDGELTNRRAGAQWVARRLADILFVEVLRRYQLQQPCAPFLAALADPALSAALQGMHREPGRAWQVDELAELAELSRGVFAERFHELVGEPPLRYLRGWRLLRARQTLRHRGIGVREIARQAGYRSTSGFRRAFRRFFGRTPTDMRRREP